MALLATPVPYDPTGILLKQRVLWITAGVMKEITASIVAADATAAAARVTAEAAMSGATLTAALAADAAAAAALLALETASWTS